MNESKINRKKMTIFLFKALDMTLMLILLGTVAYTIFYAEEKEYMIFVCIGLLAGVTGFGRFLHKRIAIMHVSLEMLQREQKTEEQRTLMSTRHTTVSAAKTTASITNPTTKKK